MTYGWSNERRANLLIGHLEGAAKIACETLRHGDQLNYELVKQMILNSSANTTSLRARAQNEVMKGIRRRPGEGITDYGLRVLRTVRDSVLPDTGDETIEDMAGTHFLHYLGDATIQDILVLQKSEMTYHQLIDKAATLHEHRTATGYSGYSRQGDRANRPFENERSRFQSPGAVNARPPGNPQGAFVPRNPNFTPLPRTENTYRRISCENCGRNGHLSRDCWEPRRRTQVGQSHGNRPTNARANAIDHGEPAEEILRAVLGSQGASNSRAPHCPTVISSSRTNETSLPKQPCAAEGLPRFWKTQVIPIANHPEKGITHRMVDLEGRYKDLFIGTPKGPQPTTRLKIFGIEVECLTDAGAEINLITRECLQYIIDAARLNPKDMGWHPPVYQDCRAANETSIHFVGALSMPVERGAEQIWIELQIPTTPLPQPIVLGTNGLQALGIHLIDTLTGERILGGVSEKHVTTGAVETSQPMESIWMRTEDELIARAQSALRAKATTHSKAEWLPMDRLGPIPEECALQYEGEDARQQLMKKRVGATAVRGSNSNPIVHVANAIAASGPQEQTVQGPSSASHSTHLQQDSTEMDFSKRLIRVKRIVFLPEELAAEKEFVDGDSFQRETYSDIGSLGALVLNAKFADSCEDVLMVLPPVTNELYPQIVKALLEHLSNVQARVYVIPPPPVLSEHYEAAMDAFMAHFANTPQTSIVRLEHRMKTFYSVGWAGAASSLTGRHSKDGKWTKDGRVAIMKFLQESMGVKWPFSQTTKERNAAKGEVAKPVRVSYMPRECVVRQVPNQRYGPTRYAPHPRYFDPMPPARHIDDSQRRERSTRKEADHREPKERERHKKHGQHERKRHKSHRHDKESKEQRSGRAPFPSPPRLQERATGSRQRLQSAKSERKTGQRLRDDGQSKGSDLSRRLDDISLQEDDERMEQ